MGSPGGVVLSMACTGVVVLGTRNDKSASNVDVDEFEQAEGLELPGADLSNEELSVRVLPRQADEFTCMSCFLVHHRSQLAREKNGQPICRDCD